MFKETWAVTSKLYGGKSSELVAIIKEQEGAPRMNEKEQGEAKIMLFF